MKCKIIEFKQSYGIAIDPENVEELALLVRMGINATKEVQQLNTSVQSGVNMGTWVEIGKLKNSTTVVPKQKR